MSTIEERIGIVLDGKYRVDRVIGEGGFAVVYGGVHERTGRKIAIKILNPELTRSKGTVERFLKEAQAAATIEHPNVVSVIDMGENEEIVYLVLELLDGEPLGERLEREGAISPEETFEAVGPILAALDHVHRAGMIHRDLKPDNIFLHRDAEGNVVPKLLDFGIAKTGGGTKTRTGTIMGTPHFMSPEQARGRSDLSPAADIWSIGVILWLAMSGEYPFEGDQPLTILTQIVTERLPPFAERVASIPPAVGAVVDRCVEPEVEARFSSAREVADAFRAALDGVAPEPLPGMVTMPLGGTEASDGEDAGRAKTMMATPTGPMITPAGEVLPKGSTLPMDAKEVQSQAGRRSIGLIAAVVLAVLGLGAGIAAWAVVQGGDEEVAHPGEVEGHEDLAAQAPTEPAGAEVRTEIGAEIGAEIGSEAGDATEEQEASAEPVGAELVEGEGAEGETEAIPEGEEPPPATTQARTVGGRTGGARRSAHTSAGAAGSASASSGASAGAAEATASSGAAGTRGTSAGGSSAGSGSSGTSSRSGSSGSSSGSSGSGGARLGTNQAPVIGL